MRRDILQFYQEAAQFGPVVRFQVEPLGLWSPWVLHGLFHPDAVKHVLQDHQQSYGNAVFMDQMKTAFGAGLTFSDGSVWRQQRRLLQPAFHRQCLADYAATMVDLTAGMLDRWQHSAYQATPFDTLEEMNRLTILISGKTLFGIDLGRAADTVEYALSTLRRYFNTRFLQAYPTPAAVPTLGNYQFWQAVRTLDQLVYPIIAERRQAQAQNVQNAQNGTRQPGQTNLLTLLLQPDTTDTTDTADTADTKDAGRGLSDTQIRDEMLTFLIGATGTTAVVLAWTWYLLARHPHIDQAVREEVTSVLNGEAPTLEALSQLPYTRMVVQEALRLYPPNWLTARTALTDDTINGYHIPADSIVVLSPYITHRHPDFWPSSETFDPERFTQERIAARPRYAYFPFGGGPRQCIGNEFALMEAQLIISMIAQRYQLRLVAGQSPEPDPLLALRPQPGLWMTLQPVKIVST